MREGRTYSSQMYFDRTGTIGGGGNSGFQALNLAAQFGAKRVLLFGYDMNGGGEKVHWYGRNAWPRANNPGPDQMCRWAKAFDGAARQLKERGVQVLNLSLGSAIHAFEKMTLDQALARWQ